MALKLVRSGPVTRQGVVNPGSGWVNVTGFNQQDIGNPYWESKSFALVTVSAWNVEDLRLYVWGTPESVQPPKSGEAFTVSTVLDLRNAPLVIRVLNPTAETKVIINMQPLSLSLSLVNALTAFVRRWRHGSETRRHAAHGVCGRRHQQRLGVHHPTTRRLVILDTRPHLPHTRHVLGAGQHGSRIRAQAHTPRNLTHWWAGRHHHPRRLPPLQRKCGSAHAHTPRLTHAGGGA